MKRHVIAQLICTCIYLSGVYDPQLIGDKAKWFEQNLPNIQHCLHAEATTLVSAVNMVDEIMSSHHDGDLPTDESGMTTRFYR